MPDGATPRHTTLIQPPCGNGFGIVAPGPWEVVNAVARRGPAKFRGVSRQAAPSRFDRPLRAHGRLAAAHEIERGV